MMKVGLNRLTFLKIYKEGRILVSWLPNHCLCFTIWLLFVKQLFHFESKCQVSRNYLYYHRSIFQWMLTITQKSFSTFPSLPQHPPITNSTALLLQQLLKIFFQAYYPLFYPWVTLPLHLPHLFLSRSFLPTICEIRAFSNHFNNLTVSQI